MITATGQSGITRLTVVAARTGPTALEALQTSRGAEADHWRSAIDAMLSWRSDPSRFDPDDRPSRDIIDTAIDYAHDELEGGGNTLAPASVIPSGNGRVAMEWNEGEYTVVVEFIALGKAIHTVFRNGKMEHRDILHRDPKSRKMEIRG